MKEIPLTQGFVALVDDEDYEWLSQWKWCAQMHRNAPRAVRSVTVDGKHKTVLMHRQIMDAPSDRQVDHINHDTLFNCKRNLRLCTHAQNLVNRYKMRGCSSRYKGVVWDKPRKKWRAQITVSNHVTNLGRFDREKDAARAYNVRAGKEWGEFALLNEV